MRKRNVFEEDLTAIISYELGTSLVNIRYRQMTEFISLKYGINIAREDIRKLYNDINDIGSRGSRKKKTQNH